MEVMQRMLWAEPDPNKPPANTPTKAMARATDPTTSHEAASKFVASGSRESHSERILAWLVVHPESTFRDIANGLDMEPQQVNKRLPELVRQHKIVSCGKSSEEYPKTLYRAATNDE